MSTIINGTSSAITFPDSSVQNTSAIVSGYVPYANLPAGSVLQVVNANYGTPVVNATSTMADTGLTATITPKFSTSKILVIVDQSGCAKAGNNYMQLSLYRNGSFAATFGAALGYTNTTEQLRYGGVGMSLLDTPATTSALTYKTQFNSANNASSVTVQDNNALSTITLMEIAG